MKYQNIKVHLEKLYKIAKEHPSGSRSVINGYNASAEYVWEEINDVLKDNEYLKLQNKKYNLLNFHKCSSLFIGYIDICS